MGVGFVTGMTRTLVLTETQVADYTRDPRWRLLDEPINNHTQG